MGARSPHKPKRNAKRSSRKGEQTVETNHPVDGSPKRLCGPPGGAVPDSTSLSAESFKRGHFSPSKHPCPATEGSVRDLPCSNREPGARSICGQRVHSRTEPKSPSDSSGSELDRAAGNLSLFRQRLCRNWRAFCEPEPFWLGGCCMLLPHRTAKAFRRFIHWMERLLCLLTFSGGTLRVPLLACGGFSPPHPVASF